MSPLLIALAVLTLGLLLVVGFTLFAGDRLFDHDTEPDAIVEIPRGDGGWLHADRFLQEGVSKGVVITCHGIGANRKHMDFDEDHSLARAIHRAGYEVWNIDLRGVGKSKQRHPIDRRWSVDDHVLIDVPAVLTAATAQTGATRVHWVGHSMGGLVMYGWLASHPEEDRVASVVTLGSPVWGPPSLVERIMAAPAVLIARLLPALPGHWPARALALLVVPVPLPFQPITPSNYRVADLRRMAWRITEPLSGRAASQLSRMWFGQGFTSEDNSVDYLARLALVNVPVRIIASMGDHMAPPHTVSPAADHWGGPDCDLVVLDAPLNGQAPPCHAALLNGRVAPLLIYPLVLDWLDTHPA